MTDDMRSLVEEWFEETAKEGPMSVIDLYADLTCYIRARLSDYVKENMK